MSDELRKLLEGMREFLDNVEWAGSTDYGLASCCASCSAYPPYGEEPANHEPDCDLVALRNDIDRHLRGEACSEPKT